MSSPSKKSSPAIDVKSQKPIKIERNEDEKANGLPVRKPKIYRMIMDESDELPVQSQTSNDLTGSTLVGRSGRVRKAKIVFDPSDMEVVSKRKSWSVTENEVKPKKVARSSDAKKEVMPTPPPANTETAKKIDNRRKTTGACVAIAAATDENGCIVCMRSDIKKGRFVVCINCTTRGHFTCLRNAKFLCSAPEEKHWQCAKCLRCAQCNDTKKEGNLFKCTLCFMSFHLTCMQERSGPVTKKKFKCDDCLAVEQGNENDEIVKDVVEVNKTNALANKSPGNGFAGFSQEETNKSTTSSRSSSSGCSSDIRAESTHMQQSQSEHQRKSSMPKPVPLHRSLSSSNKSYGAQSPPLFDTADIKSDLTNLKIELETRSTTSDRETNKIAFGHSKKKTAIKPISTDDTHNSEPNEEKHCIDINYDLRTQIRPHESIPDVKRWNCDEVFTYFLGTTTAEYAHLFREHQIDGDALLLIKREDVLNRFNLKLGPALRLYSHIVTLQFKNNNPILAWDED